MFVVPFIQLYRLFAGACWRWGVCADRLQRNRGREGGPWRPVLVATVHYEASFAGAQLWSARSSPGSKPTWVSAFPARSRSAGRSRPDCRYRQPLATLDEIDLKLQPNRPRPNSAPPPACWARPPPPNSAPKDLRARAGPRKCADGYRARAAAMRLGASQSRERSVELTKNLSLMRRWSRTPAASSPRRWSKPGQVVASGQPPFASRASPKRSGRRDPGNAGRRAKDGTATVTLWSEPINLCRKACVRSRLPRSRPRDLSGQILVAEPATASRSA